jgi:hypothetical protein
VGVGRGLDGQSCQAATSLTGHSAGPAPRVPVFRRPGAAGGPPGHPAHHPGGWLRADQVPARRHRVRHLLNRSGCCRGGRQAAGQVARLRRPVSVGLTHLRHRTWADRTPAEIMPSKGSSCSPLGRAEREHGHLTIRSAQPGARVTRAQSAGRSRFTGPGSGPSVETMHKRQACRRPAPARLWLPPKDATVSGHGRRQMEPLSAICAGIECDAARPSGAGRLILGCNRSWRGSRGADGRVTCRLVSPSCSGRRRPATGSFGRRGRVR